MIDVRPFSSLGRFDFDWLKARYHFAFGEYRDAKRLGVGPLIVWNDDTIAPDGGFPMHGHRDMEIITYVREGAISHRDHLGNDGRTEAGDIQIMSAGKGIMHSEFNHEEEPCLLYQIWIAPNVQGIQPRWETHRFPKESRGEGLTLLASGRPDAPEGTPVIYQDAALLVGTLAAGERHVHALESGRQAYLVVAKGRVTVNGESLGTRDGAVVGDEDEVVLEAEEESEVLLADLPGGAAWR